MFFKRWKLGIRPDVLPVNKTLRVLTNHFHLSARTIADMYKERWKIELCFREIKQKPLWIGIAGRTPEPAKSEK